MTFIGDEKKIPLKVRHSRRNPMQLFCRRQKDFLLKYPTVKSIHVLGNVEGSNQYGAIKQSVKESSLPIRKSIE